MTERRRVALALGSGGARGYAHIGVIDELEQRGFEIVGVAGTSMGALVGGLHAAGHLGDYATWVQSLSQRDVLRLLDPTFSGPGVVRAEKIFARVSEFVGDTLIEDLPIPFTAVATDLTARKEVWFQRGRLDAAIRASVAIPGIVTPVVMNGRLLADGGLMNPLPVVPMAAVPADLTVGVSLSEDHVTTGGWRADTSRAADVSDDSGSWHDDLFRTVTRWLENIRGQAQSTDDEDVASLPASLRTRDVLDLSLDALRSVVANYRLAGYPPDVLITIPRDACGTMDFHRAGEMIELGRQRTGTTLDRELDA